MASSSSSSPQQRFQVFLSFRGEDTRQSFTSHLHAALKRKGIDTYVDYRLEKGEEINTLFTVIAESTISIIVLSKNYASSSWCLEELSKILECKKTMGQKVVPIFYHVDPSDVRKQTGSFEEGFAKQQKRFEYDTDKVDRWRAALVEVADLSGFHLRGQPNDRLESEVVEEIAEDVAKKLMGKSFVDTKPLVGIDRRVKDIESRLCFYSNDICIVGIWGMGGIGKTTIAEAVYNKCKCSGEFEGYCFVNVRKELNYRQKLFSEILGDKNLIVDTNSLDASIIDRLRRKKVFFVLDDVNDLEQLDLLVLKFGLGSRIIVTSREKQVLETVRVRVEHVEQVRYVTYEVRGLVCDEALELFSLCAFGQKHPKKDFVGLSMEVVRYVEGLPLALTVFGSSLCGKSLVLWEGDMKTLKEIPDHRKIKDVLKISFDGLNKRLQDIFLDIACFFNWEHRDYVESILGSSGIRDLIDRSLITISYGNKIKMHDLLQQMAWNIIRQQSENPGNRSRLWTHEDICYVLENETGTESVEGMGLDLSKISQEVCISPKAFARMCNLRFLKFHYPYRSKRETKLSLKNGLVSFGRMLRYLYWDGYPSKSLPSKFCPENLVELSMPNSDVEQLWDGVPNLVKLKRLDLNRSRYLIKIPDLSQAINLEIMDLRNCEKLENFPSIVHLRSLKRLTLTKCSNVKKFPEIPKNLEYLCLSGTPIEEVPSSIGPLVGLKTLKLSSCGKLKILPTSIRELKYLTHLHLGDCSNLTKFPEIPKNLEYLCLSGTPIEEVPSSIGHLVGLEILQLSCCEKLKNLPSSIRELKYLRELYLRYCSNVTKFPEIPVNLETLDLSGTSIEQVPSSIDCHSKLDRLHLRDCSKLCSLPRNSSKLKSCSEFTVSGFSKWEVIQQLSGIIVELNIHPSYKTAEIYGIHFRRFLSHDCSLFAFTNLTCMSSLTKLNLSRNNFETIPVCIKDLFLRLLDISCCERLQSLPPLPACLESLRADGCKSLEAVSSAFPIIPHVDQEFLFANCLKLDQNWINYFKTPESYQQKATADVKRYHEKYLEASDKDYDHEYSDEEPDPHLKSSLSFYFPGSEIPKWFGWKSEGSSVTIQLPPHLHDDNKFVGFALCAVFEFTVLAYRHLVLLGKYPVFCEYSSNTNNDTVHHFVLFCSIIPSFSDSDHVWLGYHFDFYRCWYGDKSKHHPIEVSFKFCIGYRPDDFSEYGVVKECGVCLLYAQPSEESNSIMIQPGCSYDPNRPSLQCCVNKQDIADSLVEDEAEPSGNLSFAEEEEPKRKRLKYT